MASRLLILGLKKGGAELVGTRIMGAKGEKVDLPVVNGRTRAIMRAGMIMLIADTAGVRLFGWFSKWDVGSRRRGLVKR